MSSVDGGGDETSIVDICKGKIVDALGTDNVKVTGTYSTSMDVYVYEFVNVSVDVVCLSITSNKYRYVCHVTHSHIFPVPVHALLHMLVMLVITNHQNVAIQSNKYDTIIHTMRNEMK